MAKLTLEEEAAASRRAAVDRLRTKLDVPHSSAMRALVRARGDEARAEDILHSWSHHRAVLASEQEVRGAYQRNASRELQKAISASEFVSLVKALRAVQWLDQERM